MELPDYIDVYQAARTLAGKGLKATPPGILLWAREGLSDGAGGVVRLKNARIGRQVYTSLPWLEEFFRAVAEARARAKDAKRQPTLQSPVRQFKQTRRSTHRQQQIDAALAEIARW